MTKRNKRVLSLLLALVLVLGLAEPALAAETASTMRLAGVDGTATVTNASGKETEIRDDMRLYNGYTVQTDKGSYAYISLDGSKVVKLDASSEVTLTKAGRKLELKASAGKLFFNVKAPLKKGESLNIRTSTMVTGIRGTSGWIEVNSRFESRLYLLDGIVTVSCTDPASGKTMQQTVKAGQMIRSIPEKLGTQGDDQQILVLEDFHEEDVPGYVREEIAKDPELQQKIREQTKLNVEELIVTAEEKRREDEQRAEEEDRRIQEEASKQKTDKVDPVFEPVQEPEYTPSSGNTGAQAVTYDFDNPRFETVQNALLDSPENAVVNVNNAEIENMRSPENEGLNVPPNRTLNINSGEMALDSPNAPASIEGTLNVNQGAVLSNQSAIEIKSNESLHIYGTLVNSGNIIVGIDGNPGALILEENATLDNKDGYISVGSEAETESGLGRMTVKPGATIQSNGATDIEIFAGSTLEDLRVGVTEENMLHVHNLGTVSIPNGVTVKQSITLTDGIWETAITVEPQAKLELSYVTVQADTENFVVMAKEGAEVALEEAVVTQHGNGSAISLIEAKLNHQSSTVQSDGGTGIVLSGKSSVDGSSDTMTKILGFTCGVDGSNAETQTDQDQIIRGCHIELLSNNTDACALRLPADAVWDREIVFTVEGEFVLEDGTDDVDRKNPENVEKLKRGWNQFGTISGFSPSVSIETENSITTVTITAPY